MFIPWLGELGLNKSPIKEFQNNRVNSTQMQSYKYVGKAPFLKKK